MTKRVQTCIDRDKVSIFILIDALGWIYIKDRLFLDDILKTKRKVKSILGYSSGVIPSILTGEYPHRHRHWSLYYYSPNSSPFGWTKKIPWPPKKILNSRIGRKVVEVISQRKSGYKGYFETYVIPVEYLRLFNICESRNIYKPNSIDEVKTIFDILEEKGIDYTCLYYPTSDEEIFKKAERSLRTSSAPFYFLYLCQMDSLLHKSCREQDKVNKAIDWYENQIRLIYRVAKENFKEVNLYVLSDHGMTPTENTFNLMAEVERLNLDIPQDFVPMYDSTMARFWFFSQRAREKIEDLLNGLGCGRLLGDEELRGLGAYFPDHRFGEDIFLMNPGVLITPSFMSNNSLEGMHGFHPSIESSDAMIVSNQEIEDKLQDVKDFFGLFLKEIKKKG